jgi:hypothetical protein
MPRVSATRYVNQAWTLSGHFPSLKVVKMKKLSKKEEMKIMKWSARHNREIGVTEDGSC